MNTNDLPLAQKLAALMEAGRACNPDAKHLHEHWGDGKHSGCAMTFAAMGAGIDTDLMMPSQIFSALADELGATAAEVGAIARRVIHMNDEKRADLAEIVQAVRDGTLPEAPPAPVYYGLSFSDMVFSSKVVGDAVKITMDFKSIFVDEYAKIQTKTFKAAVAKAYEEPSKIRKGKKWSAPVPRGCYA